MEKRKQLLDQFFDQYAARFNKALKDETPDFEGTAVSFASCFIEASPAGVNCGKNDQQFRSALPKGYAFYRNIGITRMDIVSKEITLFDDYHAMVKIQWRSLFTRKNKSNGSFEFSVMYFVQTINNEHKIFGYITGDEQAALKEMGLI